MLAAYQATTGAHTARVQVRIRIDAQGGSGAAVHATELADGVIDFTHGTARLSTQLPTGGRSESRLVAGVLYTQTPAALTAQPGHKPWLQVTLPPGTALSTGSDPTQLLSLLRGAATLIRTVGTEKVRGTDTTHYTTQINLTTLAQEASPSPPPGRPDPTAVLRWLFGRDTLPLELWVDNQQRIRRLQTTLPTHRQNGAGPTQPAGATATPQASGSATTTEEFYTFGVAVDVLAPPNRPGPDRPHNHRRSGSRPTDRRPLTSPDNATASASRGDDNAVARPLVQELQTESDDGSRAASSDPPPP